MFRRETRSSIVHINNDKERDITLYKGHGGLYIGATDLSILNGARVTIILQAENANIHSFGTPSAKPIVDAFLSGTTPSINKVKASKIARLQREVAQLNMEKTIEDKRNQIAILHMKKIQDENPGMAPNLVFSIILHNKSSFQFYYHHHQINLCNHLIL
uniref:Uncharacterized protein n=1 Tax=Avena sativa TaxID=4498 RepID=A0ACD6A3Z6_AVESA